MSESSIHERVYGEVIERLPEYRPPKLWRRLSRGSDLRRAPADPAAFLSKLQKLFTVEDLMKTKVVELSGSGVPALSPSLCDSQAVILALRSSPGRSPFELMLDTGCLSQRLPPICALLGDERMRKLVAKSDRPICVTPSMIDTAVLLSFGFPSAVAAGLEGLRHEHLQIFRCCFQLDLRGDMERKPNFLLNEKSDSPLWLLGDVLQDSDFEPPEICLVGWSVAQLELKEPQGLSAVISHLDKLGRYLELTLEDFRLWDPSQEDVDRIRFCLEHGSRSDVRAAMTQSLADSKSELFNPALDKSPKELAEALGELQNVLSQEDAMKGQEQLAWRECQEAVHRELVAPLIAQADAVADPVERSFCVAAANVAQLVHTQALALKSKMMKQGRQSSAAALSKDEVQTLMSMTDRLLKLGKELQECGKPPAWKPSK